MQTATRPDIYQSVTDALAAQLEQGVKPWQKPWHAEHAAGRITQPLRWDGQKYKGINVLILWMTAEAKGYSAPLWLTFRQCKELGGFIKSGEKSSQVVYADRITKEDENGDEKDIFFLKQYNVFNAEQTEGLPAHYYAMQQPRLDPEERDAVAEAFIHATGATIRHGGNAAYYTKAEDRIQLPPFEFFRNAEAYYSTALHELSHWTGHARRLNRELKSRRDRDAYAREELVAELSSCFLSADLEIAPVPREDHAAYLAHWLEILKADKRAIFQAAAFAQKAADYLHSLQPKPLA